MYSTRFRAALAGGLAGLAAGLVFAALHAVVIVPIWDQLVFGMASAAVTGLAAGWAFVELGFDPERAEGRSSWGAHAKAGLRFGLILFLAVTPVSLADAALRLTGVAPRFELVAVGVALVLAVGAGIVLGTRFGGGSRRAKIAGVVTVLLLTITMAGPVPLPNGARAIGIFLAVLPACLVAGAILGLAVRASRTGLASVPSTATQ